MEIIDTIQHLELTYRFAIFFGIVFAGMMCCREYLSEVIERVPAPVDDWLDGSLGILVFASLCVVAVGVVRFGVQIIFGV